MAWLEGSALGFAMRETGVWTYAVVNLIHILGVALLFGAIFVLDLRMLGFWPQVSLGQLSRPTVAIAGTGFAIAATTGLGLLATKTTEYYGNPFLPIKLAAIVLGLANILIVHNLAAWRTRDNPALRAQERRHLRFAGAASIVVWLTAISAGRMIAYW